MVMDRASLRAMLQERAQVLWTFEAEALADCIDVPAARRWAAARYYVATRHPEETGQRVIAAPVPEVDHDGA